MEAVRWRRRVNPRVVLAPRRDLHAIEGEVELDVVASEGAVAPARSANDIVFPTSPAHPSEMDAAIKPKPAGPRIGHEKADCLSAVLREVDRPPV